MGQAVTRRLGVGARAAPRRAMERRDPRVQDAPAAPASLAAPAGRKPKSKAPLPPADTKCTDDSAVDNSVESSAFIMEQKENVIDKDIQLSVVLPGDVIKSTTVHGSKPMMDLLIFLCAQYHLNPSSHTIDLLSAENNTIKFKPNTPIGMLEVEKVILKPKILDKRKPTPIIPEKTVRVVINFKKTQKAIVRVSPHALLQELVPTICSKCEFDPLHTLLLKDYQSQEPLDLTKSLNELGLRELYAMDVSKATSVTAFNKSSLQESCQIPQNLDIMKEKENKGFFSFFQRSKKKREQTASAPATPLISKHRPTFTRSNTISKPYVSNTLPSDAPKKRRAPLPPMSGSQSAPQDLAHIQERPDSCVMKSMSVDETDKNSYGVGLVRTSSLQLSNTSVGSSSLKRTKRKAPSPPSKIPLHQSDESFQATDGVSEANSTEGLSSPDTSFGPGPSSHELCTVPKEASQCSGSPEAAVASLTSGISSDFSLEEIDEKEELNEVPKDEAENISLKSQDISFGTTDIISTPNSVPDLSLGNDMEESSQNCKEKQETRNTDGQGPGIMEHNKSIEEEVPDSIRNLKSLDANQNADQNKIIAIPTNTEDMKNGVRRTEITVGDVAKNNSVDVEVDRLLNNEAHKTNTAKNYKENNLATSTIPEQNLNQSSAEKTKMQDAAIQTTLPSSNSFEGNDQILNLSDFNIEGNVQAFANHKSAQHSSLNTQDSVDTFRKLRNQGSLNVQSQHQLNNKDPISAHGNDDLLPPVDGTDKNSAASNMKNSPLYRQDSNPRPKPSNEITRDYIPKIGLTTYKIVPPKSLEMLKDWDSEAIVNRDDQESHTSEKKHSHQNVQETLTRSEDAVISESPKEPQADSRHIPPQRAEPQLPIADRSPRSPTANPLKPAPRLMRDTGTIPFAPKLEEINNILESKIKPQISNPQAKPSSFFLQMQKRASGHYVTSAASKSAHTAPNPVPREQKEIERDPLPSPEHMLPPLSKAVRSPPPPSPIKHTDNGFGSQNPKGTSPPPVAPKPASLLSSQFSSLNLKTLKTFGAPRPYSSSAPSPFALAVVKRSQSFSKSSTGSGSDRASTSPPSETLGGKILPAGNPCVDRPQLGGTAKENDSAHDEQNFQALPSADCSALPLKRQSSLRVQSSNSDPEQVRQSLLTAIRSGEAVAKLKRVAVPSNTISVNGRSGVSHSTTCDAQDDH